MPKVLHPFSADFFDTMVEVELQESEEEITQDLVFKKGIERVLKIVDERGRPLETIDIFGQTWTRALQPNAKLENSTIKLAGLGPEESRVVVLMTADVDRASIWTSVVESPPSSRLNWNAVHRFAVAC